MKLEKSFLLNKPTIGVCYYPEHWSKDLWENDLDRMLDSGIEVIRIGEFAWNKFEAEEGIYTFEFFDEFMDLAEKKSMKVIFCTPTATPPAWMSHKYPEILNAREDGVLYRHGNRRHNTYNSPIYNEFTKKIVEQLAKHYGNHKSIIGWQIDNEFNCHMWNFYSESDHKAFRNYLKAKFNTLDKLNDAMGTAFWNQTYTSFDEIYLSRPNVESSNNPHMALEEKRFISFSTIRYCKLQSDILRSIVNPEQFITTNGIFGHLDSHEMTNSSLDFITYDSYPNFAYDTWTKPKEEGKLNDRSSSWSLTRARSISPLFGIMEQQAGAGGWDSKMKQPTPKPGQMRLWTYQSLAHGADFISFFRWRTCWIGTEIYWHGLNNYSNEEGRRIKELKVIRDEFKLLNSIAGAKYKAKVALIRDYDNQWDGEQDKWHGPLDEYSDNAWFHGAQITHTPLDFLYLQNGTKKTCLDDLVKYDMLVYAHATILTKETADLLRSYVEQGGLLIMGARTGYKDEYGRCPMRTMPGHAGAICAAKVEDFTHLSPADEMEYIQWGEDRIEAPIFNDILKPLEGGEVLGTFSGNYYDGEPGLVMNRLGEGRAYYYGAGFSVDTVTTFLRKLEMAEPYDDLIQLPKELELAIREKDNVKYLFVLNYLDKDMEIELKVPMYDLLSNTMRSGSLVLGKYGVAIYRL